MVQATKAQYWPPRTIRPGPATQSTTIQPHPLPSIWTRWQKESDPNQDAIPPDAKWEEDTDNENESENTLTQSEVPEVPVSVVSEVYTTYQVRFSALRKECIKHNTRRYQYSCEFKLSAISFAKQYAMPRLFADETLVHHWWANIRLNRLLELVERYCNIGCVMKIQFWN